MYQKEKAKMDVITKICSKCKKELHCTPEYFHRKAASNDGYDYICKECRREIVNTKIGNVPKNQRKVCSLCKKEFPATKTYFELKPQAKDGLAYECRGCRNKRTRKRLQESKISSLRLHFTSCIDTLEELRKDAFNQMRTPENQAVWILNAYYKGIIK